MRPANDQLAAAVEQIGQRFLSVRSVENIFLVDLNPGKFSPRGADRVPLPSKFFFSGQ